MALGLKKTPASRYTFRISVTNNCNLNCVYCNPLRKTDVAKNLSDDEIVSILKAAYEAGLRNITWTGGEPTSRIHFTEIVSKAKEIGYKNQHITTNGIVYYLLADKLKEAGITRVNFSLDTLDREQFKKLCGMDGLDKVLKSIKKAVDIYGESKINSVIIQSNFNSIEKLIKFTESFNGKLTTRFLELVPCGSKYVENPTYFSNELLPIYEIVSYLAQKGKLILQKNTGNVPGSIYYKIEGMKGIYGVNPSYSNNYLCTKEKCNKIRMNPEGYVSNCTIQLKYTRNLQGKSYKEKVKLMKEIIVEKQNRDYTNFKHKQRFYDFWRFAIHSKEVDKILKQKETIN